MGERLAAQRIPSNLVHRRRHWWSRCCVCGLRWPCPDRRYRPAPAELPNRARWIDNAQTVAYPQVGRAGWLTPAQTWRANGGRW